MRLGLLQAAAVGLLCAQPALSTHGHGHRRAHHDFAKRHTHSHVEAPLTEEPVVKKRALCSLPTDDDSLFHVPGALNNGFAMSPDQECADGDYCPIACKPGMVMAQWEEGSNYQTTSRMNGGLYCNGGKAQKPFPDRPYCVQGTGAVVVQNTCGKTVAFCQTVLPGNEAMLIPTAVESTATLAVPDQSYWDGTASHFYINPPGYTTDEACIWGTPDKPIGNWSPYVAGANTIGDGVTFVKIGFNPIWTGSNLASEMPTWGVRIEGDGLIGGPCEIDPVKDGVGVVKSLSSAIGAGGAAFCVVTVPKGKQAKIIVFNSDGSTGKPSPAPVPTPTPETKPEPTPTPTSTKVETPISTPSTPASTPKTVAPSSSWSSSWSSTYSSSWSTPSSTTGGGDDVLLGGIFHENSTSSANTPSSSSSGTVSTPEQPASTGSDLDAAKSDAASEHGSSAIAGLIVALVAAAALY